MVTRRQAFKNASLLSLASGFPGLLTCTANEIATQKNCRVLVVVQLNGGNDGLNTVVPLGNPVYERLRPTLKLNKGETIALSDGVGLHGAMREISEIWQAQQLAIVHGVGYPNPNRSHEVSMAVWHHGTPDLEKESYGWIGRSLDDQPMTAHQSIQTSTGSIVHALQGRISGPSVLSRNLPQPEKAWFDVAEHSPGPEANDRNKSDFIRQQLHKAEATAATIKSWQNSHNNGAQYPASPIGQQLSFIASLLKSDVSARVFYAAQEGYDTHSSQKQDHAQLLQSFSSAIGAFLKDLNDTEISERVVVMCFSEFGRRVEENASQGTDHGTAGPVFLFGKNINGRQYGAMPDLTDLSDGDPQHTVDFRQVYATLLNGWMDVDSKKVLGKYYPTLPVFAVDV